MATGHITTDGVDWRNGIPVSPPFDQRPNPICTACAVAATIEAIWAVNHSGQTISVSPGYLHICVAYDSDASRITANVDLAHMAIYVMGNRTDGKKHLAGYALLHPGDHPFLAPICLEQNSHPLQGFMEIVGAKSTDISDAAKHHLRDKGPLVADMRVWPDFESWTPGSGPYGPGNDDGTNPYLHSVCVVGYNSQGWIIKNSFGPNWGDSGFGVVAYGACSLIDGTRSTYSIEL